MNSQYNYPNSSRLIQDIQEKPASQSGGFSWKNHLSDAIGDLSHKWTGYGVRQRYNDGDTLRRRLRTQSMSAVALPAYTRISPLRILDITKVSFLRSLLIYAGLYSTFLITKLRFMLLPAYSRFSQMIVRAANNISAPLHKLAMLFADTFPWHNWAWRPTKYTLKKGVQLDLDRPTFIWTKRFALPLMSALIVILSAVILWPMPEFGQNKPPANRNPAVSTSPKEDKNKPGNSTTNNSSTATTTNPTSAQNGIKSTKAANGQRSTTTTWSIPTPTNSWSVRPSSGQTGAQQTVPVTPNQPVPGRGEGTSTSPPSTTTSPPPPPEPSAPLITPPQIPALPNPAPVVPDPAECLCQILN